MASQRSSAAYIFISLVLCTTQMYPMLEPKKPKSITMSRLCSTAKSSGCTTQKCCYATAACCCLCFAGTFPHAPLHIDIPKWHPKHQSYAYEHPSHVFIKQNIVAPHQSKSNQEKQEIRWQKLLDKGWQDGFNGTEAADLVKFTKENPGSNFMDNHSGYSHYIKGHNNGVRSRFDKAKVMASRKEAANKERKNLGIKTSDEWFYYDGEHDGRQGLQQWSSIKTFPDSQRSAYQAGYRQGTEQREWQSLFNDGRKDGLEGIKAYWVKVLERNLQADFLKEHNDYKYYMEGHREGLLARAKAAE